MSDTHTLVINGLQNYMTREQIIESYGITAEQFQAAIRERNQAARALLHEWMTDASGYEEENADAIDRAIPISS